MAFHSLHGAALAALLCPIAACATPQCAQLVKVLSTVLADIQCTESADLTTANPATTPPDNSIAGLPPFAFTPQTDRSVIAPDAAHRTPITKAVAGVQIDARIAGDPAGQARVLLRLPADWNGRLVVAGASGTRSEFNGDFAWSDYVVQRGYAYASQNKGVLNLQLSTSSDPLACRLNPSSTTYVRFYDDEAGQPFTRWAQYMVEGAQIAKAGVRAAYGSAARYTYAVGTSNGGYQVRRALEAAPRVFDGGVDWEGTYVDDRAPNLLSDLPPAVLNWPDYAASGFAAGGTAALNIQAASYPPDIVVGTTSFWGQHWLQFWEVTQCQWQKRLDPAYDTYRSGTAAYNYSAREAASDVAANMASIATTGRITAPLVTVAGTMDALLPINHHARAYARRVAAWREARTPSGDAPAYRLYEVQNGNHIETYKTSFAALEFIEPHAQRAFDLLVDQVEHGVALPPDQCIPHGGSIAAAPAEPGHCSSLFVP